jgi:hypothetical protein
MASWHSHWSVFQTLKVNCVLRHFVRIDFAQLKLHIVKCYGILIMQILIWIYRDCTYIFPLYSSSGIPSTKLFWSLLLVKTPRCTCKHSLACNVFLSGIKTCIKWTYVHVRNRPCCTYSIYLPLSLHPCFRLVFMVAVSERDSSSRKFFRTSDHAHFQCM